MKDMKKSARSFRKIIGLPVWFVVVLSLVLSSFNQVFLVNSTQAWDCSEEGRERRARFYGQNDIPTFYDPCDAGCSVSSGALDGPAPTELVGEEPSEKVWNYFIQRGLTPVAAAGALGNIEQESGFNPWIGESGSTSINPHDMGVGFGLIQWTNTDGNSQGRRYGVIKAMEAAGINLANIDQSSTSQTDMALLAQLNWLWDGEYGKMTWQEPLNAETKIEGDTSKNAFGDNTGNGTALLFHSLVERSADGPAGLQERIDSSKSWFDKYSGGNSTDLSSCGDIGQGGLTLDQAKVLMESYRNDPDAASVEGMGWFMSGSGGICAAGTTQCKENCTAFSTYFVGKFTDYAANASGDGAVKVDRLLAINSGAQFGSEPRPFSVFQVGGGTYGHTGIVLGIHGEKAVIGEANWGQGPSGIRAIEMNVSELLSGYKFMYVDDKLKQDELRSAIGG